VQPARSQPSRVPTQAALAAAARPDKVTIADACAPRALPRTGGLDGKLQDGALIMLDTAVCRVDSSREELALALLDAEHARAYMNRHERSTLARWTISCPRSSAPVDRCGDSSSACWTA
jgi:hypothetical protein